MIREGVIIGGRYEIMSRIGSGGMADVYKGRDHKLNRFVAVKVLKREFREDELFVKKFQTEAQSAAGLIHPNVVNVYDVGEDRGLYYIVMELVEGITLKDYIEKKGRLTTKEVISIALQVSAGIEAAHNHHIVHRDIKPQNIIISRDGKVKVTDFGIAKATSSNTISTNAMGSVHYTSPEQARGGFSDEKSDIYSLGVTMYEMITGELPFDGESTVAIALKHLQEELVVPSEYVPEIPYSLEQIILKCMQKSPNRRYRNMGELMIDLRRSLADPDGDFVVIEANSSMSDTRTMTPAEMERIQNMTRYDEDDPDEEKERKARIAKKKEDVNPNMAKIIKILAIVAAVIIVFVLVLVIGKGAGLFGKNTNNPTATQGDEKVEVPELVSRTEAEAKELCEEAGLEMKVILRELTENYDTGIVSEQKTQMGTKVPKGTVIQVVVSIGLKPKEFDVPDVRNEAEEDAINSLIDAGFDKDDIKVTYRSDSTVKQGYVVETTPSANETVTESSTVNVVVSNGTPKSIVPPIVDITKNEAMAALEKAGLKGTSTSEYSDVKKGIVISQSVNSGEEVDEGTTISFVVSKGPEPTPVVTIPSNLTGKSISSVKATLQNLGLVLEVLYGESYEYNEGFVYSVPDSGETVEEGSTVVVYVSTGPGPSTVEPNAPKPSDDKTVNGDQGDGQTE